MNTSRCHPPPCHPPPQTCGLLQSALLCSPHSLCWDIAANPLYALRNKVCQHGFSRLVHARKQKITVSIQHAKATTDRRTRAAPSTLPSLKVTARRPARLLHPLAARPQPPHLRASQAPLGNCGPQGAVPSPGEDAQGLRTTPKLAEAPSPRGVPPATPSPSTWRPPVRRLATRPRGEREGKRGAGGVLRLAVPLSRGGRAAHKVGPPGTLRTVPRSHCLAVGTMAVGGVRGRPVAARGCRAVVNSCGVRGTGLAAGFPQESCNRHKHGETGTALRAAVSFCSVR